MDPVRDFLQSNSGLALNLNLEVKVLIKANRSASYDFLHFQQSVWKAKLYLQQEKITSAARMFDLESRGLASRKLRTIRLSADYPFRCYGFRLIAEEVA